MPEGTPSVRFATPWSGTACDWRPHCTRTSPQAVLVAPWSLSWVLQDVLDYVAIDFWGAKPKTPWNLSLNHEFMKNHTCFLWSPAAELQQQFHCLVQWQALQRQLQLHVWDLGGLANLFVAQLVGAVKTQEDQRLPVLLDSSNHWRENTCIMYYITYMQYTHGYAVIYTHCIALHCIALHCIAVHHITAHHSTVQYSTVQYIILSQSYYITLHHITSHHIHIYTYT